MFKRLLKWVGGALAAVCVLVAAAAAYVFIASERVVAHTYAAPLVAFSAPTDAASIERGRREAVIQGCTACHGADLRGHVMFDEPGIARIRTANVTQEIKYYSDAELERLLRRGVKRDGAGVWIMPAASHLCDEDLGAIIAYLRSLPEVEGPSSNVSLGPIGRIGVVTGKFQSTAANPHEPPMTQAQLADPMNRGRYLIKSACTECHGARLQGSEIVKSPSLLVAAAYDEANFTKLMRTGVGLGGRELGKMTLISRARFSAFSDDEIAAIRLYLNEFVRRGGTQMP